MVSRRAQFLYAVLGLVVLIVLLQQSNVKEHWRDLPKQVGLGEFVEDLEYTSSWSKNGSITLLGGQKPLYTPGKPKAPGSEYRRVLVIPRTSWEDVSWMNSEIPDVEKAIYVADDPSAPLHPPENKGHEVMIYLTYIIDHYDDLPDIMIFMHSHRYSWHNMDIFEGDAAKMISHLSNERVMREGYMNMRCQWGPGCPEWMHPGETSDDAGKKEQVLLARSWAELFPLDPVPTVLAQPCCAQFAISRHRVRQIPKQKFEQYREWVIRTPLKDFVSGRVWEYLWQFVFTGRSKVCPAEHVCTCDGYGVCFGGEEKYEEWFELQDKREKFKHSLEEWKQRGEKRKKFIELGLVEEAAAIEQPEVGKDKYFEKMIKKLNKEMADRVEAAIERGNDPETRAKEVGRPWKDGDGF